jgi:hypothetical protein
MELFSDKKHALSLKISQKCYHLPLDNPKKDPIVNLQENILGLSGGKDTYENNSLYQDHT